MANKFEDLWIKDILMILSKSADNDIRIESTAVVDGRHTLWLDANGLGVRLFG